MLSFLKPVALFFMLVLLAGCGFRPLYATDETGTSVATDLSSISIDETGTRIGQQLRNRLISTMRPSGQEGQNLYRLVLSPKLSETGLGDQSLTDGTGRRGIKRVRVALSVNYQLFDQQSGKVVNTGRSFSNVGYDSLYEPIADRQAKSNATERAVLEVSNDIRTRLAAYMSSRRS